MPRVRAIWVLGAAQAAVYPHLTKDGSRNWWNSWTQRAQGIISSATKNMNEVKSWLKQVLGSGFST